MRLKGWKKTPTPSPFSPWSIWWKVLHASFFLKRSVGTRWWLTRDEGMRQSLDKKRHKGESPLVSRGVMGLDAGREEGRRNGRIIPSPLSSLYIIIHIPTYRQVADLWDSLNGTINTIVSCNLACTIINLHIVTWWITASYSYLSWNSSKYSKGGSSHRERGWSLGVFYSLITQMWLFLSRRNEINP